MIEKILANRRAPKWMWDVFKDEGTAGVLRLSDGLILLRVGDMTPKDVAGLRGAVRIRVHRGRHVLLLNLLTRTLSFDLWWSPIIARMNGEGPIEAGRGSHPLMTIIAMDGRGIVRNIRSATFSPEVAVAISRSMGELLETVCTEDDIMLEIDAISLLYDGRPPETFFHATCSLGD